MQILTKRQSLLEKFKKLFPDIYKDGMTVSEADGTLIINPTPGKRGKRYYFKYKQDARWELKYE